MVGRVIALGLLCLVLGGSAASEPLPSLFPRADIVISIDPHTLKIKNVGFATGELEQHLQRIAAHLNTPALRRLQENHFKFLAMTGDHPLGCDDDLSGDAEAVLQSHAADDDPAGLRLLVASSYLGRCGNPAAISRLKSQYRAIATKAEDRTLQAVLYPSSIGFYCDGDLEVPAKEKYLFAIRAGLIWSAYRSRTTLPEEFEIPLIRLNQSMRPGGLSEKGFLGQEEDYSSVVAADQNLLARETLDGKPLSARALGDHLYALLRTFHRTIQSPAAPEQSPMQFVGDIDFDGIPFHLECDTSAARWQISPFKDGLQGLCDYKITNLKSRETMEIASLVPHLIAVRAFFEGKGTPYRVDPMHLLRLLTYR